MKHIIISIVVICMLISSACAAGELKDSAVVDKTKETLKEVEKGIHVRDTSADIAKYNVLKEKDKITISKAETIKDSKVEHTKTKLVMDEKTAKSIDTDKDGKFGYLRKVNGQVVDIKVVTLKELTTGIDATFSEVIIDGFAGSYTKTGSSQTVSANMSLGQSFNSSKTSAVTLNLSTTEYDDPYSEIAALNPVAWYKLDDTSGTVIRDSSGNGYHGTAYNGPTWVTGKYNNGMCFDGANDYAQVPCYFNNSSGTFLLTFWRNDDTPITTLKHVAGVINTSLGRCYISLGNNGILVAGLGAHSAANFNTGISPTVNRKYVVELWWNETHERLLVDNVVYISQLRSGTISTTLQPVFGGINNNNGTTRYYTNVTIDNVLIFDRTINRTEETTLYYDVLQQLQTRTNSNSTYSEYWNGTANNPISVVYGTGESISSLNFKIPTNVTQNGVTIYNYNQTVAPFTPTASVYFTEDITEVTDSHTATMQTVNITHTSTNTADNGSIIPYEILDGYDGTAVLTTNNTNASISQNETHFIISTGYISAGSTYYYLVEIPTIRITSYTPTNNNVSNLYNKNTLYTVHVSEASDIVWKIDNSTYKTVSSVTSDSLSYGSTLDAGMHNITANIINSYGDLTDSNTWNVDVLTRFENMGSSLTDDINESYLLMGTLLISLMGITILIILYGAFTGKIDIPLALMAVLAIIISSALMVISIIMLNALIELI